MNSDTTSTHYRGDPYNDPGASALDNYDCDLSTNILTTSLVDINRYGTYEVIYTLEDESGNVAKETRSVDIILPVEDYYSLEYQAYDTCTSYNYFYTALIQDCDCPDPLSVTVSNLSNFGQSALFTLPISGTYQEYLTLDTTKAAIHFEGFGIMTPGADTINWSYSISDSINTDVCKSVWIKH